MSIEWGKIQPVTGACFLSLTSMGSKKHTLVTKYTSSLSGVLFLLYYYYEGVGALVSD